MSQKYDFNYFELGSHFSCAETFQGEFENLVRLEITNVDDGRGFAIGKNQISNSYFDYKNEIFIFKGYISGDENDKSIELAKWSIHTKQL
jgi:hypothetical protein